MGMDISFNREDALKAGYSLVRYWDDLIPGEEKEGELFEWQFEGETIRQTNWGGDDNIIVQYLRNGGKGEFLKDQLERRGVTCDVW